MGPDGFGRSRTRRIGTDRMGPKGLDGFITVSTMVWQSWPERVVENKKQFTAPHVCSYQEGRKILLYDSPPGGSQVDGLPPAPVLRGVRVILSGDSFFEQPSEHFDRFQLLQEPLHHLF